MHSHYVYAIRMNAEDKLEHLTKVWKRHLGEPGAGLGIIAVGVDSQQTRSE